MCTKKFHRLLKHFLKRCDSHSQIRQKLLDCNKFLLEGEEGEVFLRQEVEKTQ